MKIEVDPPDINISDINFHPINKSTISFGLNAIKNVVTKGHLVEGRIMASKFQLDPGGLTYLISAISFRKGNKYKLHKTPTAIKRAAKLLNKTEQEIIECSIILEKEGLFTFDDDYPLKEYLQKTRRK